MWALGSGFQLPRLHWPRGPILTATPTSNSGVEPSPPAHRIGDLLVVACSANSGTIPTVDGGSGWNTWGPGFSSASRSMAYFWRRATANNHTITITGETGLRQAWAFRNAELDGVPVYQNSAGASATIVFPAITLGAPRCLVGGFIYAITAQTDATAMLPTNMTARGARTASAAGLGFDSNTLRFNSITVGSTTADTSTNTYISSLFSIKRKWS